MFFGHPGRGIFTVKILQPQKTARFQESAQTRDSGFYRPALQGTPCSCCKSLLPPILLQFCFSVPSLPEVSKVPTVSGFDTIGVFVGLAMGVRGQLSQSHAVYRGTPLETTASVASDLIMQQEDPAGRSSR